MRSLYTGFERKTIEFTYFGLCVIEKITQHNITKLMPIGRQGRLSSPPNRYLARLWQEVELVSSSFRSYTYFSSVSHSHLNNKQHLSLSHPYIHLLFWFYYPNYPNLECLATWLDIGLYS